MNRLRVLLCTTALTACCTGVFAQDADTLRNRDLDWAIADTGNVNCPERHTDTYPACLTQGGRSCLMRKAIDSAQHKDCDNAFGLALITQCHREGKDARDRFNAIGAKEKIVSISQIRI